MKWLSVLGLALAIGATACSGSDGDVGANGGAVAVDSTHPAPAEDSADDGAASTRETRSAVCMAQTSKRCLDRSDVQDCESELSVFSQKYVLAFGRCVDRLASCESRSAVQVCKEEALLEIAPGFPALPEIARCKDRNIACSTAYPGDRPIKAQIDGACERLVGLEKGVRKRADKCLAEQGCNQFAECIRDIY